LRILKGLLQFSHHSLESREVSSHFAEEKRKRTIKIEMQMEWKFILKENQEIKKETSNVELSDRNEEIRPKKMEKWSLELFLVWFVLDSMY
jgi:DNA recombination-dependent growth factor C